MAKAVKSAGKPATAELVPAEQESDLSFAQSAGSAVVSFLKRATEFFKKAEDLEYKSRAVFDQVKALKLPTNGDEDVALQSIIKRCGVGKKTSRRIGRQRQRARHHEDPASLHKRTANRRDVSVKLLTEAEAIGNRLHNEYTAAENRRAEAETRRLQAIEDEKARKVREEELARLELLALEAEAESEELSDRERKFVEAVANCNYEPVVAARAAGYKNPESKGAQLLTYTKISGAIEALRNANALRQQAAAVKVAPIEVRQVEVKPDIRIGTRARTT